MGASKMKELARKYFWWPGLDGELESLVKTCPKCLENRDLPKKSPLHPWEWPMVPWHRVHVDYAGLMNGVYYLVLVDAHSKWVEIFPTQTITSKLLLLLLTDEHITIRNKQRAIDLRTTGFLKRDAPTWEKERKEWCNQETDVQSRQKVRTQKCAHSQDKKSGQKSVSTININLKYNKISKKLILHLKFNLKSIKNSLETDSLQCAITGSLKLPHTLVYHLRLKTIPQFC